MKRSLVVATAAAVYLAVGLGGSSGAAESRAGARVTEDYVHVPMPPGFQVINTELEGPVFADAQGHTLYKWPISSLRNGYAGDPKDKSACDDTMTTKTAGLMSPYPPGLDLPDLGKRRSCAAEWPPVLASDDAKPIDRWTILTRSDGKKQWVYDHHALYTSIIDHVPGEALGGSGLNRPGGDAPADREPVGPPPAVPPGFVVDTTVRGRMLITDKHRSVYVSDSDGPNKSNCFGACAAMWQPILAAQADLPQGEWTIVARAPGVRQWAFRKKPVYTFVEDEGSAKLDGSDVPGWHNVYTQFTPAPPREFTVQTTVNGDVLADSHGHTIYIYTCADDSQDQLTCDTMEGPQEYRVAIGGGGDAARTLKLWPYVVARPNAKSDSHLWSIVTVDPATGHRAQPNQSGALRVWAFRDRPVYTYAPDKQAGDIEGDPTGEWQGRRNGYRAYYVRNEFFSGRG